jgi:hypothetical protein
VKQQQTKQQQPDSDRNERIIKRAVEIMAQGHYGWSWALKQAEKETK